MALIQQRQSVRQNSRVLAAGGCDSYTFASLEQGVLSDGLMYLLLERGIEALTAQLQQIVLVSTTVLLRHP